MYVSHSCENGHCTKKCSMTTVAKLHINMCHMETIQKAMTFLGLSAFKKPKRLKSYIKT